TGVGHNAYSQFFNRYDFSRGEFGKDRAVHSSWFAVLSELGFPGLAIYVLVIVNSFRICWRVRRVATGRPQLTHLGLYATAIESALISFAVGSTFVNLQYCEMLWHFVALSLVLDRLARAPRPSTEPSRPSHAVAAAPLTSVIHTGTPDSSGPDPRSF